MYERDGAPFDAFTHAAWSWFDETHEDFRSKEKRKRSLGQQNRDGNWVEEEKRALRHSGANFDS